MQRGGCSPGPVSHEAGRLGAGCVKRRGTLASQGHPFKLRPALGALSEPAGAQTPPPPDGHGQASGQPGAGEGTAGRRGLRAPWKMMPQAFEDRAWCTWSGTRSSSTTNREQATFVLNLRKPRKQTFPNCQERRSTGCGGPAQWGRGRAGASEKTPHANLMFTFELFLDPTSGAAGGCRSRALPPGQGAAGSEDEAAPPQGHVPGALLLLQPSPPPSL